MTLNGAFVTGAVIGTCLPIPLAIIAALVVVLWWKPLELQTPQGTDT